MSDSDNLGGQKWPQNWTLDGELVNEFVFKIMSWKKDQTLIFRPKGHFVNSSIHNSRQKKEIKKCCNYVVHTQKNYTSTTPWILLKSKARRNTIQSEETKKNISNVFFSTKFHIIIILQQYPAKKFWNYSFKWKLTYGNVKKILTGLRIRYIQRHLTTK